MSSQPGRSQNQKRLMAIRSARMAMRDLAEQIHGLKVEGNTTVIDLMVQNDTFRGIVSGTIRGARTVRINPTGSDTYGVLLEIDKDIKSISQDKFVALLKEIVFMMRALAFNWISIVAIVFSIGISQFMRRILLGLLKQLDVPSLKMTNCSIPLVAELFEDALYWLLFMGVLNRGILVCKY